MYSRRPRRIGTPGFDFEGVYEFYQMLERRETRERCLSLWKLCMALSVPVVLVIFSYLSANYVNWKPLTAGLHQFM